MNAPLVSMPTNKEFLTIDELASQLGTTRGALAKLRERRMGPPYVKIGRTISYPVVSLRVWCLKQLEGQS